MISILTPAGSKGLILRGLLTGGANKAVASGSITAPGPVDYQFWDGSSLAALVVSADPPSSQGAMASALDVTVNTDWVTATASGGSAPYTYAWTVEDDGGFGGWEIINPSSAATYFRAVGVGGSPSEVWVATMRCTATDARGATGYVDVPVTAINYGPL